MTLSLTKSLALCGLCALSAGIGTAASAQNDFHRHDRPMHHARPAIQRQKAAYSRAVASGHREAAERAHFKAMAIRRRAYAHHEMHRDHRY